MPDRETNDGLTESESSGHMPVVISKIKKIGSTKIFITIAVIILFVILIVYMMSKSSKSGSSAKFTKSDQSSSSNDPKVDELVSLINNYDHDSNIV
jgi:flagellar basal body-associated protein FliL